MNPAKWVVLCVLVPFVLFSVWCTATGGTFGEVVAAFGGNPWFTQVSLDLYLALSMVSVWIWRDARARGANPIPWIAATLLTGSIAPLTYLLLRPEAGAEQSR